MFGGWLPSIFGRSRNRSEEDITDSDRVDKSKSKSGKKSSSSSSKKVEEDLLIERWTIACLNSVVLPPKQELSAVFAPLPLLALFCIIWMTAADDVRKHMKAVCGIDKKSLAAFASTLSSLPAINQSSLFIYRVLTTPDQYKTIDELFMKKLQKRFGRRALIAVEREKQKEYIRTNTKRLISDLLVPSSAGLLGFAAAAVVERWQGETRPYADRPFALNQKEKQMHECFEWRGVTRMRRDRKVDACLLPLRDSPLSLVILRPTERGGIVRLRREMTAKDLHATLWKLAEQTPEASRVLLPRVDLHSRAPSLLPKWRLSGVMAERVRFRRMGGDKVCPQFREIAHGASIRIDERGIHTAVDERRPRSSSSSHYSYYSAAIDQSIDPNFNLRIDCPFLFFVVHTESMAPILAGTYAGNALITPYTRSLSVKSTKRKSVVRKSVDLLSRPITKARDMSVKSSKSWRSKSVKSDNKKSESEKKKKKGCHSPCSYCEQVTKRSISESTKKN
ncbi:hypothetical protein PFISCL1PPCAC_9602, partial [Pristionchus fissidentatus]